MTGKWRLCPCLEHAVVRQADPCQAPIGALDNICDSQDERGDLIIRRKVNHANVLVPIESSHRWRMKKQILRKDVFCVGQYVKDMTYKV